MAMLRNIPIIYEDNHILVIEKPVNIPSQEDSSHDPDVISILKQDIKKRYDKPGNVYLSLVHRLDRPVGGIMVLAKTSKAAARLSSEIREGSFKKNYLCIVNGTPQRASGFLENYLYKDAERNIVRIVEKGVPGAKKAVLEYKTLETSKDVSLIWVKLHTGRSHQIRVQLAEIGHPLYGDQKYGGEFAAPGEQIALWSSQISFMHPTRGINISFVSKPPKQDPWNLFHIG